MPTLLPSASAVITTSAMRAASVSLELGGRPTCHAPRRVRTAIATEHPTPGTTARFAAVSRSNRRELGGMGIRDFRVWEARPIRKCPAADHPGLVAFASLVKAASRATRRGTSALRRFTKHAGGLPKRRAVRDGPA